MRGWIAAGACAAASGLIMAFTAPTAAARPTSPPECVMVRLMEPKAGGQVPIWLDFCGEGSGADSPMQDNAAPDSFVADGEYLDPNNCIKAQPCVIFGHMKPAGTAK